MKSMMRLSLLVLTACLCAPSPNASADQFGTVDGQGADPLLDAYPFFIFPNSTKIAQIVFETSSVWSPPVPLTLDVQCCTDFALGTSVQPAGVTFEAVSDIEGPGPSAPSGAQHGPPVQLGQQRLPPNQFLPTARVARMVGLKVTTGANPKPGRYVAIVKVGDPYRSLSLSTQVIVNVLPPLTESATPSCAAFTTSPGAREVSAGFSPVGATLIPTDPLVPLVKPLFDAKVTMLNQATTSLAPMTWNAAGMHTVGLTVTKSNLPLSPTQAVLSFLNSTRGEQEFVAFNTAICVPVLHIPLKSGESGTLLADPMTTTILVRQNSGGWKSISVLSEPQLWTLLGGRTVSFNWMPSISDP
jgi:hypothetical protein